MKVHSGRLHPNHRLNMIEFKILNGLLDPQLGMIPLELGEIKLRQLAGMAAPKPPWKLDSYEPPGCG